MTTYTTTCPHCQAKFLINDQQLNLKSGKARCGNCSKVFQANDYLSEPSSPAQKTQKQVTPKTISNSQLTGLASSASLFEQSMSQTGLEAIQESTIARYTDSNKTDQNSNELENLMNASLGDDALADENKDFDDNALFDDNYDANNNIASKNSPAKAKATTELFSDDMELDDGFVSSVNNKAIDKNQLDSSNIFGDEISSDFKDTFSTMDAVDPFDVSIADQSAVSSNNASVSDEEWVKALLSDDEPASTVPEKSKKEQSDDLVGFLEDIGANTAQFSAISPSQLASQQQAESLEGQGDESLAKLPARQIRTKTRSGNGVGKILSSVLWLILALVGIITLGAQYLYFNYDTLARDAKGREYLTQACGYAGCNVPNINADAISFTEVKTTDNEGKSKLTFVLNNQSKEPTLFPSVKVTLYKGDKEVGGNVVLPSDYLHGSYKKLPALQPIDGKVNLSIAKNQYDGIKLEALY